MRIDGTNGPTGPKRPDGSVPAGPQRAPDSSKAGPSDRAEFSEDALRIASLAEAAARLPEVRADRVRALRDEIGDGTYRVDARSLARAILEFEDDLAGR